MSDIITFAPLSLADVFALGSVAVYEYGKDAVLTDRQKTGEHLLHLFENEIGDRVIYGLNRGKHIQNLGIPLFVGEVSAVEVFYAHDEKNWDFGTLTLLAEDGSTLRIDRHDESFPEPTFRIRRNSGDTTAEFRGH